jgi:hypothetical protein
MARGWQPTWTQSRRYPPFQCDLSATPQKHRAPAEAEGRNAQRYRGVELRAEAEVRPVARTLSQVPLQLTLLQLKHDNRGNSYARYP